MKTVKKLIVSVMIMAIALSCIACDMQAKTYKASDLKYFTFTQIEGGYAVSAKDVSNLPETLALPYEYEGEKVIEVATKGFEGAIIKNLIVPKSIRVIGERAFANSKVQDIQFFTGVEKIATAAFFGCTELKSLNLPVSVLSIGDSAFNACVSLTSVKLPEKLLLIGRVSFANCLSLESVYIPRRVQAIGDHAFMNCAENIQFEISAGNEYYKLDENGRPVKR